MKWKIFIGFFLVTFGASAHQPDISTAMLIEQGKGHWVLQLNTSLTALQYEVKTHFPEGAYKTPEEFQQLVIDHMRENLIVVFNKTDTTSLKNAYVKLGHAASVVFELSNVPETMNEVYVKNESFKDIHRNQCAFGIVKKGISSDQFALNENNQHEVRLILKEDQFVSVTADSNESIAVYLYIVLGLLTCVLGMLFFKTIKSKKYGFLTQIDRLKISN